MPLVEDKSKKKRWIVYQSDLKVYNPARTVFGILFGTIFLPVILLTYIGKGAEWLADKIRVHIVVFLSAWVTVIILHKHKEYPKVVKM